MDQLSTEPGFWDKQEKAQSLMRQRSLAQDKIEMIEGLSGRVNDALDFLEMAMAEGDSRVAQDIEGQFAGLETEIKQRELTRMLSGPVDHANAIVSIHPGSGGTEAKDWGEMLLRMYLRWAERHRFATEIIDQQEGEQAGLKSVTVEVGGRRAYGWLRAERGVHR
ncbi:MAG TPA: PCRF domain-containing protein, partial [Polyangiaceae bacterium]|nr:PCRF domain-containing protein [Polyangiaceae bacterium]